MFNFHVYCAEALLPRSTLSSLSLFLSLSLSLSSLFLSPLALYTSLFCFLVLPIFSFYFLIPFILFHIFVSPSVLHLDILISFFVTRFFFSLFVEIILGLRIRYVRVQQKFGLYIHKYARSHNTTHSLFLYSFLITFFFSLTLSLSILLFFTIPSSASLQPPSSFTL